MRLGLERIELHEFRCFQQLYVVMNTHMRRVLDANGLTSVEKTVGPLTVLVAKNGMGKTAVLDAIRILFGTFTSAFSGNSRVGAKNGDVRISRNEAGELRQADGLAVSGVVVLGNEHHQVCRELSSEEKARTTTAGVKSITDKGAELCEFSSCGDIVDRPVLAFYGTGRLWVNTRDGERRKALLKKEDFGYEDCLGRTHNFKAVNEWLTQAVMMRVITENDSLKKNLAIEGQLKAVVSALGVVLRAEGYEPELTIEAETESLAIKSRADDGYIPVPVSQLSDGVKAAFGLTADIAFRCAKLNPHFGAEAAARTEGLVMIDEIDMHLHPSWQQKILNTLQLAFPRVQFVVTTHSPQVVSSVPRECLRILDQGRVHTPSSQTEGVESQLVLAEIFGANATPPDIEWVNKLDRYAKLMSGPVSQEEESLSAELEEHYGKHYQPLERIRLLSRFKRGKR